MKKIKNSAPKHIAIIMDGNRRWAKKNKLKVFRGHEIMVREKLEILIDACVDKGIEYLTLWAFSTENWKRNKVEVTVLMNLFRELFDKHAPRLHAKGIKIETIGDMTRFDKDIQKNISKWKEVTENNKSITLVLAINYGGRDEVVRAVNHLLEDIDTDKIKLKQHDVSHSGRKWLITEEFFNKYLDTSKFPNPDLIIRTSGEQRMSGFLSWSGSYSEYIFTKTLMPDFDEKTLDQALEELSKRKRRFGK